MMPVMDGFEATQLIRQLVPNRDILTIAALSAMTHNEDAEKIFKSGMDVFSKCIMWLTCVLYS